jgi:hypothetical protein
MIIEDDGVNDEEALDMACDELEVEGFWEDVKRRYGIKHSVASQMKSAGVDTKSGKKTNDKRSF